MRNNPPYNRMRSSEIRTLKDMLAFCLLVSIVFGAQSAFALPWDGGLQTILADFQGTTVKIVATLCLIAGIVGLMVSENGPVMKWVLRVVVCISALAGVGSIVASIMNASGS